MTANCFLLFWIKTILVLLFLLFLLFGAIPLIVTKPMKGCWKKVDFDHSFIAKNQRRSPWLLRLGVLDGRKSKIRAHVEHVFATQKECMGLFIHNIGLDRAHIKIALANLAYNINRLTFWEKRTTITG